MTAMTAKFKWTIILQSYTYNVWLTLYFFPTILKRGNRRRNVPFIIFKIWRCVSCVKRNFAWPWIFAIFFFFQECCLREFRCIGVEHILFFPLHVCLFIYFPSCRIYNEKYNFLLKLKFNKLTKQFLIGNCFAWFNNKTNSQLCRNS